jgi:hydrogenase-4 component F
VSGTPLLFGIPAGDAALPLILGTPAVAALLLTVLRGYRVAAWTNVAASAVTLAASLLPFVERPATTPFFLIDDFNIYLVALTAFVAFTTSLFSARYVLHEVAIGRLVARYLRFYHAMYQAFIFTMLLALTANNLGVVWVAIEGATLTTVLMVGLYRTHEALEAAWKYFILCGVGIALALFGTTLMYLAAQPVMGEGLRAMTWSELLPKVSLFSPAILNLAFVFLLVGYGTKVGLAPLHAWLPDAHAEGPTPISAVLSGLLLNVALYVVLRYKMLLAANPLAVAPGPLMVTMGLSSLLLASLMLYRRRDIKRLFAYSSIEHMGIITFAFGMGGALANFAGLLHMTMHSLTKSAIFFAVGHVSQLKGTQRIAEIRGLTTSQPLLGWALVIGVVAIAGLPPFGVFTSEFLVLTTTFARQPVLALLLLVGLLTGLGALMMRLQGLAFGPSEGGGKASSAALLPLFLHFGMVLMAGIYLPGPLVAWFQNVAKLLG